MALVTCSCGKRLTVKDELRVKHVRCPVCGEPVQLAASGERLPPPPCPAGQTQRAPLKTDPATHYVASLGWLLLGLNLALLAPWLGLLHPGIALFINTLPLLVTIGLIAWNLLAAIRLVGRTGHTLSAAPLTLLQFLLFQLLFFQIACHVGADSYKWDATPSSWEWPFFGLIQAVRAGDLLDFLEAYGFKLQTIEHAGILVSCCLVAYHLILDLFFIRLVLEAVDCLKRNLLKRLPRWNLKYVTLGVVAAFVLAWLVTVFAVGWRAADVCLWPLDNLLRVVDFVDALQIFHVHLHQVPDSFWQSTLTFLCRTLIFLGLAQSLDTLGTAIKMRWLNGFAMSRAKLEELLHDQATEPAMGAKAAERLALLDREPEDLGWEWNPLPSMGRASRMFALGMVVLLIGTAVVLTPRTAARSLGNIAANPDDSRGFQALAVLRRMGSYAEPVTPLLFQALPKLSHERRVETVRTLGELGPAACELLGDLIQEDDEEVALTAAEALARQGPARVALLARGLASLHESVRAVVKRAVRDWGVEATQPLIDSITPGNAALRLPLLAEVDPPYWRRRAAANGVCKMLLAEWQVLKPRLRREIDALEAFNEDVARGRTKATSWGHPFQLNALMMEGPWVTQAVPAVVRAIENEAQALEGMPEGSLSIMWTHILESVGETGLPAVRHLLANRHLKVRRYGAHVFLLQVKIRSTRKRPMTGLTADVRRLLADEDSGVRRAGIAAAVVMGPRAVSLVPALTARAEDATEDKAVRQSARDAVRIIQRQPIPMRRRR